MADGVDAFDVPLNKENISIKSIYLFSSKKNFYHCNGIFQGNSLV